MKGLLGKKLGMTQVYLENGDCVPVTVIQVERCVPVDKRTQDKNGYDAVVVAYGQRKPKHTNKPLAGYYSKIKAEPARVLQEFRNLEVADDAMGQQLKVDAFAEGELVDVVGVSKGRGFSGVVRRYNFRGQPASRGTHESFRGGGSIGMHTYPGRTLKGQKMAGRMGGKKVHAKNLKVVRVDAGNNLILVRGSVPGANGRLVRIVEAKAGGKK